MRCPITIFIEANNNSEVQFEYLLLLRPPFLCSATISILNIAYLTNTLVSFQRLTLNGRLKRWKTDRQTDGPHLSHFICIRLLSLSMVFCLLSFAVQLPLSVWLFVLFLWKFMWHFYLRVASFAPLWRHLFAEAKKETDRQTVAQRGRERERRPRAREMADSLSAVCSSWYMACLYRLKLKRLFCIYESHMNVNLSIRLLSLSASMNVSSW